MFDNQFRQGEWRGWRSSFARKFGVIGCSSIPRFSSLFENFVRIRCMISLGFASVWPIENATRGSPGGLSKLR